MAVFYSERAIKATRKTHRCFVCPQMIEAGSPAIYFAMRDDYFLDGHYHVDCREAEIALNNLRGTWGKDWQGLYDLDAEDRDWLQAEYPAVYARKYGKGSTPNAEMEARVTSPASTPTLAGDVVGGAG